MELSYRRHEGVALVCQNNEEQRVAIYAINPRLQELTGYSADEAHELPLVQLLDTRAAALVEEDVEFDNDTRDLQAVLARARDVKLRHKDGHELAAPNFRLYRIEANDRHHWFRLVVEDESHKEETDAFKRTLSENFRGHEVLDEDTGLPDRASIEKDLELAQHFADTRGVSACFAYVRLDEYDILAARHGKKAADNALRVLSDILRRNMRGEDAVGRIEKDVLGLIIMDVAPESFRVVVNRLCWQAASHDLMLDEVKSRKLSASFCYASIAGNGAPSLILRCGERLMQEGGQLSALVALD